MDRLFETQKKTETATEKAQEQNFSHEEKHEKLNIRLKTPEEKSLQFEEQTFSVDKDVDIEKENAQKQNAPSIYLQSFENKTVADIMHEDAERRAAELRVREKQKESLAENSFDPNMTIEAFQKSAKEKPAHMDDKSEEKQNPNEEILTKQVAKEVNLQSTQEASSVIEKPNYDFLQEPKRTIILSKKSEQKKKKISKKTAGIVLACALAGSSVICATNAVLIDQMSSSFVQIDETYKFNLAKYLKNINNLDATKKSMDFLETYPDDLLNAGDLGEKSNWFDRLCNFLGGLFGG